MAQTEEATLDCGRGGMVPSAARGTAGTAGWKSRCPGTPMLTCPQRLRNEDRLP